MNHSDDKFTEKLCHLLDQSLDDLDPAVKTQLSRMKYRALHESRSHQQRKFFWAAVPVALVLLMIVVFNISQHRTVVPNFTELNILTAPEPLDFYAEDIEFYEWLSDVFDTEVQSSDHPSTGLDLTFPLTIAGRKKGEAGISDIVRPGSGTHRIYWSFHG